MGDYWEDALKAKVLDLTRRGATLEASICDAKTEAAAAELAAQMRCIRYGIALLYKLQREVREAKAIVE